MKNTIKNTKKGILMVTMFATLLSFANEVSFTIKNDANKTSLILRNVKEGNLLSIKDTNDALIYQEVIQVNGIYAKGFDLSSLPKGNYYFELEKDVEIRTIPFTVTETNTVMNSALETTIYKPITRLKGDIIYVSKLSLNKQPLTLEIYFTSADAIYTQYDLIFSEKIDNTTNISRIYRLEGLNKGTYKIVYKTEGKTFTEVIKK
jgi:hypothetical protein